ncbi:MAG: hypothetical protein H8E55_65295 [Pelagibacterales bacterium]|nr:hypothetical protein [Pelagibacterales bacterium]
MPFEKNNTYGEKTKRGKNKSSELLKEQLHKIANTVVNELDLGRLTNNQRIQLIKAVLPYLISKQKNIEDLQQEQPLFQIEITDSLSKN